jgi:hypothetical protein
MSRKLLAESEALDLSCVERQLSGIGAIRDRGPLTKKPRFE